MSFLKYSVVALVAVSIAGCAFKKDGDDESKPTQAPQFVKPDDSDANYNFQSVKGSYRPKDNLNEYTGVITWAIPTDPNVRIGIKPKGSDIFTYIEGSKGEYDFDMTGGETADFQVNVDNDLGGPIVGGEISIQAPIDFKVDDPVSADDLPTKKFGRLVITKRGSINANYKNLEIDAELLNMENGSRILTLNEEQTVSILRMLKSPLTPPTITINANVAIGQLEIDLRGYPGEQGPRGETHTFADRGLGFNGKKEADAVEKFFDCKMIQTPSPSTMGGTPGGLNVPKLVCPAPYTQPTAICVSPAVQGKDGPPGKDGGPGGIGGTGGDTGNLQLNIKDNSQFLVYLDLVPGAGGKGGPGGFGGPGQMASRAGNTFEFKDYAGHMHSPCPVSHDGVMGPDGKNGQDGLPGLSGKVGKIDLGKTQYHTVPGSQDLPPQSN